METEHSRVARWQDDALPHVVDRLARERPDSIYGVWPARPGSYEAGIQTVTYSQLANVADGLAWWLFEQLKSRPGRQVFAYLGPNDPRHPALILAAIKTGHVIFLTSPRNTPQAQKSLFDALDCQILITSHPTPPPATPFLEVTKSRHLFIPSLEELISKKHPFFEYDKRFDDARWDPIGIVHTSGSTGFPKPVTWTHESAARQIKQSSCDPGDVESIDHFWHGKRLLVTAPTFHGSSFIQYFLNSIPFGTVVIATAAVGIITAEGLVAALKQTPADVVLLVPTVVAELGQNEELLEYCAQNLQMIVYIGGDLPQALGDRVAAKVPLRCQWGATEVGIPQQLIPDGLGPTDWHYTSFHPATGAAFDKVSDGLYELVIRRDHDLASTQPSFGILGQTDLKTEYRTGDLFEPHPTVSNAWRWRSRVDDIIVFLSSDKMTPIPVEQRIMSGHPELSGALVVGSQRLQPALIIEPRVPISGPSMARDQAALVEQVWSSVVEANNLSPIYARIEKSLIMVTAADRPLIRSGKGTIQRAASVAQYAAEIDHLYANTVEDAR